jgi:hypothetical protein
VIEGYGLNDGFAVGNRCVDNQQDDNNEQTGARNPTDSHAALQAGENDHGCAPTQTSALRRAGLKEAQSLLT